MTIGQTGTATIAVTHKNTAKAVKSGNLDVFATPMMIALMEEAACAALIPHLTAGQTTVGTEIAVTHNAASPIGANITATAQITRIEGRKISFSLHAQDENKEIGQGTHTRVIVDSERFMARVVG